MTTRVPRDETIAAMTEEYDALEALVGGLHAADWTRPTACPGWDVRAQVSHIIGTESMLLGRKAPDAPAGGAAGPAATAGPADHIRNDIGRFNEAWVIGLAALTPADVNAEMVSVIGRRRDALEAVTQEQWDEEGFTPAGRDTHGRFMRIRVFDMWMHEQDIREAVGKPGHEGGRAPEVALDELESALGFIVGKKASAAAGASVTFSLTGPASRTTHVAVGERARVVDALDGPASVAITLPAHLFSRLCGGRCEAARVMDQIAIDGDAALGAAVVANLAFTV